MCWPSFSLYVIQESSLQKPSQTHTSCKLHVCWPHLFPAVAVVSLQMPFDDGMWGARLTLQERTAPLHPILNHLQSVLIGCEAEREGFYSNQTLLTGAKSILISQWGFKD